MYEIEEFKGEVLTVSFFDLEKEQFLPGSKCILEICKDHCVFTQEYYSKQWKDLNDEMQGWGEENYHNLTSVFKKSNIACIDMKFFDNKISSWAIVIELSGSSTDVFMYFETQHEVDKLYKKLLSWWLK